MPRDTLLPRLELNASARPSAIEAMITTRAMPEGTMKVSRKSVTIRPEQNAGIGDADLQHDGIGQPARHARSGRDRAKQQRAE